MSETKTQGLLPVVVPEEGGLGDGEGGAKARLARGQLRVDGSTTWIRVDDRAVGGFKRISNVET